jgi:hypothetical protein
MPSSPEQFPSRKQPGKKEARLDFEKTLEEITQLAEKKLSPQTPRRKHWKRGESADSMPRTAEETVSELEREWAEYQDKNKRDNDYDV